MRNSIDIADAPEVVDGEVLWRNNLAFAGDGLSNSSKQMGCSNKRDGVCHRFGEFLLRAQLVDLGFQGPLFTWKRDLLHQRLDSLANDAWPNSFVHHLSCLGFDHRSILFSNVDQQSRRNNVSFKNLAAWQSDPSFDEMLRSVWNDSSPLLYNVTNFLWGGSDLEQGNVWAHRLLVYAQRSIMR
ncbi:hypothetical protein V6N13_028987 [Hibiscus sabdariffa]